MKRPLTIGLDGTPLLGHRSGVGHYTGRLLAALLDHRPEGDFLLYSNRPLDPLESSLQRAGQTRRYFSRSRWLWMQLMLPKIIDQGEADLCHFTNSLAPIRLHKPFVLSIHDASLFLYSHLHPATRLLAMRLILPMVARQAAAIITVSEHARQDLSRVLQLPADKVRVIYEAAPAGFSRVTDPGRLTAVRQHYRLPEQFLLYVGTLEPRKNLNRVLQALAQLRQQGYPHHLVLVGPNGWSMGNFAGQIEALALGDTVHCLGYVPTEDLPALYSLATLFVFPSLYEGFGLPPLEAMACGTPVLTSHDSSLAEICDDAALLVNPKSVPAIGAGLRRLLDDEELRCELARRGQERAGQFSWEKAARETAVVYEQVLGL